MGLASTFASINIKASRAIDGLLPTSLQRDGNRTFIDSYAPSALQPGAVIYDVGGGAQPFVSRDVKESLGLTVVGLDISAEEMARAPTGVYDRTIAADLCTYAGTGDGDVVMCQALLEHVPNGASAIRAIASILKPGGRAFLFAPSRNAVFARLNLMLPQEVKKRLLFALFPKKATGHDGFPAYYDHCTPTEVQRLAEANGLVVEERDLFWISSYFMAFVPAYLAWRAAQGVAYMLKGEDAAETFIFVLRKPDKSEPAP